MFYVTRHRNPFDWFYLNTLILISSCEPFFNKRIIDSGIQAGFKNYPEICFQWIKSVANWLNRLNDSQNTISDFFIPNTNRAWLVQIKIDDKWRCKVKLRKGISKLLQVVNRSEGDIQKVERLSSHGRTATYIELGTLPRHYANML